MPKMAGFRSFSIIVLIIFTVLSFINEVYPSQQYKYIASVETIRKDDIIIIVSKENLSSNDFYIIQNNKKVASFSVLNISKNKKIYRITAIVNQIDSSYKIIAGSKIGFIEVEKKPIISYPDKIIKQEFDYRQNIITKKDNREMVLVPKGKFRMGSNNGEKDESPEHIVLLNDYYIDKYEVSNHDYLKYINKTSSKFPISWGNKMITKDKLNLPVQVTFYEALRYAKWAGKIIPNESYWEKAASGTKKYTSIDIEDGYIWILYPTKYPYGSRSKINITVCREYFSSNNKAAGLMPIRTFEKYNVSAYGAVNMSGNSSEWTSSWYRPYPGALVNNENYGKKFKVIRGGAWYSQLNDCRITSRDYAGMPNLYKDNISGFRCIKFPDENDIKK